MEKETKMIQVQSRFTPSEMELLRRQAEAEGRSISNLIHTVIVAYLKKVSD